MNKNEFENMLGRAGRRVCKAAGELSAGAKLTVAIETCKSRLSAIYEKIGEAVVSGALSDGGRDEEVFRYIDEARHEKNKLKELYTKRREASGKCECPSCGKDAKKGSYCSSCGEYVK